MPTTHILAEALREVIAQQPKVLNRQVPLDIFNSLTGVKVFDDTSLLLDFDNDEEVLCFEVRVKHMYTRGYSADELKQGHYTHKPEMENCQGCNCAPGDGITETCNHPDGCGFWKDAERDFQFKPDDSGDA
jgi:hypothetical protein